MAAPLAPAGCVMVRSGMPAGAVSDVKGEGNDFTGGYAAWICAVTAKVAAVCMASLIS